MNIRTKELRQLYESNWLAISKIGKSTQGLSKPLLVGITDGYEAQNAKMLIVGQQTNGWGDESVGWDIQDIDRLVQIYQDFGFGKNYYSSPFWNVVRKIEKKLSIEPHKIAWTNLNKCDFGTRRPRKDIEQELFRSFNVIPDEIRIISPNLILFFTGPNFDDHIKRIFHGAVFEKISDFNINEMCRVDFSTLPYSSYRTYHPNYLRRRGLEKKIIEKLEDLVLSHQRS